jgi:hypothetical protein
MAKIISNIINSDAYKVLIKPGLNICTGGYYDMVDQLINSVFKNRKMEFIKFLEDNSKLFQDEEIIGNNNFISGLAILYNEIIKQRFEWKRLRMYGIFLGFTSEKDKEFFELERMFYTLNLMSEESYKLCLEISKSENIDDIGMGDILELKEDVKRRKRWNINYPKGKPFFYKDKGYIDSEWVYTVEDFDSVWQLLNLGIFLDASYKDPYYANDLARNTYKDPLNISDLNRNINIGVVKKYKLSKFGKSFITSLVN